MDLRQIKSSSRFFSYVVAQPTQRLKSILKESHWSHLFKKNSNKHAKQATFATFISQANRKVFTAFKNCVLAKNHLRIRQFLLTYDRNHTIFGANIQL